MPTQIGPYTIIKELGRGGMGVVYLGRDVRLNRLVAIKMIVTGLLASTERVERFKIEAKAIALLRHHNIVQIYEIGEFEGYPYFVLEYLEGGSLEDLCHGKPQPPEWSARMVKVLAEAMAYAHQQGIVHRDLKPANILLATNKSQTGRLQANDHPEAPLLSVEECRPKLTDFGLAKLNSNNPDAAFKDARGLTHTGETMGTPNYMAPEQAQGNANRTHTAVDVYSLGAILYELLTGRPPFAGPTPMDTMISVISQEVVAARRLQPSIPRDLETICTKCLEKDPRRRYNSAAALAVDLGRYLNHEPIEARAAGPLERLWKWTQRRPAIASLIGAVVCLTFLVLISLAWALVILGEQAKSDREGKDKALASERAQSMLRDQAEAALKLAKKNLYISRIAQAQLLWERSDISQVQQLLRDCPEELRHWEWRYLHALTQSSLRSLNLEQWVFAMHLSPDGRWLAVNQGNPYGPGVSWWENQGLVRVLDAQTGQVLHQFEEPNQKNLKWLFFNQSCNRLMGCDWRNNIHTWSMPDGHHTLLNPETHEHYDLAVSSDGKLAAFAYLNKPLQLVDIGTGENLPWPGQQPAPTARVVDFSTDRQRLITIDAQGVLTAWNLNDGSALLSMNTTLIDPSRVRLSRSGQYAICITHSGKCGCLDLTKGQIICRGELNIDSTVQFNPLETHLGAIHDGQMQLWSLKTGELLHIQPSTTHDVNAFAFSPDFLYLATGGTDSTVRLFEIHTGKELTIYRGHKRGICALQFTDDGRTLWSADQSGMMHQWNITREQEMVESHDGTSLHTTFGGLAFANQGQQIRTIRSGEPLQLQTFDAATGLRQGVRHLPITNDPIYPRNDLALSQDGQWTAGIMPGSMTVGVWNAATGGQKQLLGLFPGRVMVLALNHNGSRLATVHYQSGVLPIPSLSVVIVWDVQTGQALRIGYLPMQCLSLAFANNDDRLAMGLLSTFKLADQPADQLFGPVILWHVDGRFEPLPGPDVAQDAQAVAFNANGTGVASVGFHHKQAMLLLWDLPAGRLRHALAGPRNMTGLAFSPDGQRLATTGYTHDVSLWDVQTGLIVLTLQLPDQRPRDHGYKGSVAFSPDGQRLVANNFASKLAIWHAPSMVSDPMADQSERQKAARLAAPGWHIRSLQKNNPDLQQSLRFQQMQMKQLEPLADADRLVWADKLVGLGQWQAAREQYALLFQNELKPQSHQAWTQYGLLLAYLDDMGEYRQQRSALLKERRQQTPLVNDEWAINIALATTQPLSKDDQTVILNLKNKTLTEQLNNPWLSLNLALMELRLGDPARALHYAEIWEKLEPPWITRGLGLSVQALALQKMGRWQDADTRLKGCAAYIQSLSSFRRIPECVPNIVSQDGWLLFLILHHEAQSAQQAAPRIQ